MVMDGAIDHSVTIGAGKRRAANGVAGLFLGADLLDCRALVSEHLVGLLYREELDRLLLLIVLLGLLFSLLLLLGLDFFELFLQACLDFFALLLFGLELFLVLESLLFISC
jgi:hypothetical protein